MYGHWFTGGWGGGMWGMGSLFHILIWVGLVLVVYWVIRAAVGAGNGGRSTSARDILDKRYASGELTKKEYEQMKKDLSK